MFHFEMFSLQSFSLYLYRKVNEYSYGTAITHIAGNSTINLTQYGVYLVTYTVVYSNIKATPYSLAINLQQNGNNVTGGEYSVTNIPACTQ